MDNGKPPSSRTVTILKFALKFLLAAALVAIVICSAGSKIREAFAKLSPLVLAAAVLCLFVQATATALRWKFLIDSRNIKVSFGRLFILTYQGCCANFFLPGGSVGGDVLKAGLLAAVMPKGTKVEAAVSILVDRIIGMAGLFTITLCGVLWYLPEILRFQNGWLKTTVIVLAIVNAAGLSVAAVAFFQDFIFRWKPLAALIGFGDRILHGALGRIIHSVSDYRGSWKTLVAMTLFSAFVINPLMIGAFAIPLYSLTEHSPAIGHVIAAASLGNTAAVIPGTPGGVGWRDIMASELFKAWGADDGAAAVAAVVYTAALVFNGLVGAVFFLLPMTRIPPEQKKE